MPKLYACIISPDPKRDRGALAAAAREFSYSIEMLEDGVVFDVSGLERLIGKPPLIAEKILEQLRTQNIPGSIAVAETVDTASLLARQKKGIEHVIHLPDSFQKLPLRDLEIEQDTLNVFHDLGFRRVEDLLAIPRDELIRRYGREFEKVVKTIEQQGERLLTPNVKENHVAWAYDLDFPVEDFEQLIFILNHGLDKIFAEVRHHGFSTEHLDITFRLQNKTGRDYEIKTSFPTLDKTFWLKLINLRISMDPPEAGIMAFRVTAYFTKPRPTQRGLYAVTRPESESLLLTVGKLKKLVGVDNVGVPVILNQRLARPFTLDADALPKGKEKIEVCEEHSVIAFSYFHPLVRAEVLVRDKRLIFIRTRLFAGHVREYSGVWRSNSKWWDRSWRTHEWDVEIENHGIYRLCKVDNDWFLAGEYD